MNLADAWNLLIRKLTGWGRALFLHLPNLLVAVFENPIMSYSLDLGAKGGERLAEVLERAGVAGLPRG